ncbi:MAG: hypothetical protein R3F30_11205 [Planctomycetota bacterium]
MNKRLAWLLLLPLLLLEACGSVPSKEVQELLVQRGFGRRAEGDVHVENYANVGSMIQFLPASLEVATDPAFAEVGLLLSAAQPVAIDGTIYLPLVGPTLVLGLTESQIGALVSEKLAAFYSSSNLRIDARIINQPNQVIFVFGAMGRFKVPLIATETMLDLFVALPDLGLANIGKIRLIRPDPKNPLIVTVNIRDMVLYGNTTYNLRLRENDIVYVPPTLLGQLSLFLKRLLQPITVVIDSLFRFNTLRWNWEYLTGDNLFYSPYGPVLF